MDRINNNAPNRNFFFYRAMQIASQDRIFADDTNRQIRDFTIQRAMQIAGHDSNFAIDTIRQNRNRQYNGNGMAALSNNDLTGRISLLA
jgi:hypothetical protein